MSTAIGQAMMRYISQPMGQKRSGGHDVRESAPIPIRIIVGILVVPTLILLEVFVVLAFLWIFGLVRLP